MNGSIVTDEKIKEKKRKENRERERIKMIVYMNLHVQSKITYTCYSSFSIKKKRRVETIVKNLETWEEIPRIKMQ